MQYSLMIWGTLWGYVVYNDLPDGWTWVGASVIVASGLYTLHREALAMRRRRRAANALSG
jgi:S-adenosylmethionine uptake transporter